MTVNNGIIELIKMGEGQTIEFKVSLAETREIIKTVCAFANTKGGVIIVGVGDKGVIKGVSVGRRTIEDLVLKIANSTEPRIFPEVQDMEVGKKNLIIIKVSERRDKPIFAFGVAYKRVGKNNLKMDRDEVLELLRRFGEINFEDQAICDIDEIDEEALESFIEKAMKRRKIRSIGVSSLLDNLGMIKDNKLTVAALLCFGRNPQKHLPYAILKVGKFIGGKIIYEKEIRGNLIEQIERGYAEVLGIIRKRIVGINLRREEAFEYPPEAIRELIVNAVAHRDYSSRSPVYIKIFEDIIEFENPGRLLELSIDDLKKPHRSVLRNPKIAEALYHLGYVEKWGTGTLMVMKSCLENGNGEPVFESNGVFRVKISSSERFQANEIEKEILRYLRDRGIVTRKELEKYLGVKESTVRKYLRKLRMKGLIARVGEGKNTKYRLVEI